MEGPETSAAGGSRAAQLVTEPLDCAAGRAKAADARDGESNAGGAIGLLGNTNDARPVRAFGVGSPPVDMRGKVVSARVRWF
jgi:hypothetical protein